MKLRKSNLDEQQERKLLEIESRGYWLAFWGLLVTLLVELLVMKDLRAIAGEWILLMGLALYLAISCMRAGVWARRMDMIRKTCLLASLVGALCVAGFMFGFSYLRFQRPLGALRVGAIIGLISFGVCYLVLRLVVRATQKRQDELNAEPKDEDSL